jgi:rhodanese-related sulfurtransferase
VKIKGAVREDLEKVDTWMNKYPKDKTLVFYCA